MRVELPSIWDGRKLLGGWCVFLGALSLFSLFAYHSAVLNVERLSFLWTYKALRVVVVLLELLSTLAVVLGGLSLLRSSTECRETDYRAPTLTVFLWAFIVLGSIFGLKVESFAMRSLLGLVALAVVCGVWISAPYARKFSLKLIGEALWVKWTLLLFPLLFAALVANQGHIDISELTENELGRIWIPALFAITSALCGVGYLFLLRVGDESLLRDVFYKFQCALASLVLVGGVGAGWLVPGFLLPGVAVLVVSFCSAGVLLGRRLLEGRSRKRLLWTVGLEFTGFAFGVILFLLWITHNFSEGLCSFVLLCGGLVLPVLVAVLCAEYGGVQKAVGSGAIITGGFLLGTFLLAGPGLTLHRVFSFSPLEGIFDAKPEVVGLGIQFWTVVLWSSLLVVSLCFIIGGAGMAQGRGWGRRLVVLGGWVGFVVALLNAINEITFISPARNALMEEAGLSPIMGWNDAGGIAIVTVMCCIGAGLLLLTLHHSVVESHFLREGERPSYFTDRFLENLRTWGRRPRFRKAWVSAVGMHALVILGPLLIFRLGCIEPYRIPTGGGEGPRATKIQIKVKIKRKKFLVNPHSPIIVAMLNPEDMTVDLQELTEHPYTGRRGGGKGKAKTPGFAGGVPGGEIRFLRLRYRGGDWDQDLGLHPDELVLKEFYKRTQIPTRDRGENIWITDLAKFPEDASPPFVFITGKRGISVSAKEVKILRKYLLERGGMLIADNGGGYFDHSFRRLIQKVLPGKRLIEIPKDDMIYHCYYDLPNGAPPLWHHAGTVARGIKHQRRWVVFYHPGDMNDAWKEGHSGAKPAVVEEAYKLAVNLIYYAVVNYLDWLEARGYIKLE